MPLAQPALSIDRLVLDAYTQVYRHMYAVQYIYTCTTRSHQHQTHTRQPYTHDTASRTRHTPPTPDDATRMQYIYKTRATSFGPSSPTVGAQDDNVSTFAEHPPSIYGIDATHTACCTT